MSEDEQFKLAVALSLKDEEDRKSRTIRPQKAENASLIDLISDPVETTPFSVAPNVFWPAAQSTATELTGAPLFQFDSPANFPAFAQPTESVAQFPPQMNWNNQVWSEPQKLVDLDSIEPKKNPFAVEDNTLKWNPPGVKEQTTQPSMSLAELQMQGISQNNPFQSVSPPQKPTNPSGNPFLF